MDKPKICAHAAGADLGPANSLEAARASLRILDPSDLIEIDVQQTRDGELVLTHGGMIDSVRFVLGYGGKTRNLALNDLRAIDPKIATLEQMLRLIAGRCGVVLDVKDSAIPRGRLREVVDSVHTGEVYLTAAKRSYLSESVGELNWPRVVQCRTATKDQIDAAIASCQPRVIDMWPPFLTRNKVDYVKGKGLGFVPGGMIKPFSRLGESAGNLKEYIRQGALYVVTFDPVRVKGVLEKALEFADGV